MSEFRALAMSIMKGGLKGPIVAHRGPIRYLFDGCRADRSNRRMQWKYRLVDFIDVPTVFQDRSFTIIGNHLRHRVVG